MINKLPLTGRIRSHLYALQLLEYDPLVFIKWVKNNPFFYPKEIKGRLGWSRKAGFLFIVSLVVQLISTLPVVYFLTTLKSDVLKQNSFFFIAVFIFFSLEVFPLIPLLIALYLLKPYEILNRRRTISKIKKKIESLENLRVVAVTGSFGKTTVKEILKTILSYKYKVAATPRSYNKLFSVADFIEKNITRDTEILIVETGAYHEGEIRELCRMVRPQIGIITGINIQHLDRFGSLQKIIQAKYELIESLTDKGLAVFNLDSDPCFNLYRQTKTAKIGYSRKRDADLRADNLDLHFPGTRFDISVKQTLPDDKKSFTGFKLNLPGEHNISNALAAVAVAFVLKVPINDIRKGLAEINQPEHRLQVKNTAEGLLVIDDGYSSNPEGVKAAVELVKKFNNTPKIIVTPGIVELGKEQYEENKKFGRLIAEEFDYAVIVNKTNRKALLDGLLPNGRFPPTHPIPNLPKRVFVADSLNQATKEIIPRLVKPGGLILFENDLPDIYQ